MVVRVEVFAEGSARPTAETPVVVQVRDTSLQDVRATILGEGRGVVAGAGSGRLAAVEVKVRDAVGTPTVWVHVDTDRDGRVSRGDYVTVQSNPASPQLRVVVKQV